jgi:hypothetical protein
MMRIALFAFLVIAAWAQEYRSTIAGSVRDPQQAAVPGVQILAAQTAMGTEFKTVSNESGQFVLPLLPPGNYRITVETAGFKRYVRENFAISANQRYQLDIALELGGVTETVTVEAAAPILTANTASMGQAIVTTQIENMPMNGRTPLALAQLAFGVVPTIDRQFFRPFDNNGPSGFSMGGAPQRSNELLLDGAPNMMRNRVVAYNPPVDVVGEVKVETFQADAAYGNTGGGTVNVVLKSGVNQPHGTLYEFNQVSRLAATPFFTNRAGQRKSVTRYNQYGGSGGGPVWIPRVLDGRNRLFWFFAYEGIRQNAPEPLTRTVPTPAERNGDFSALLKAGANYQIYDPATGVLEGSRIRRQPFANNIIPANRLNAIAKNYLQFFPEPNQSARADGQDNYAANTIRSDKFYNTLGRLDVNFGDRHKLFWNMRYNNRVENRNNVFNNLATGNFLTRINWGSTLDDVFTFGPTMLLNTRLSWNRFTPSNVRPSDGFDSTTLGFPAALAASSPHLVLPRIQFRDDRSFTHLGDSGGDITPFDTFQIFETFTKIQSSHSLKFGADLRQQRESGLSYGNSAGRYEFDARWTRGPLDNSTDAPLGQDLAAFLLGMPSGGNFQVQAARTQSSYYTAFFLQDDWRARSNLTFNLGLRYERETGTVERFNRTLRGFDLTAVNAVTNAAKAAYAQSPNPLLPASRFNPLGGVLFAGPQNRSAYGTEDHALSPRAGFAWTPKAFGSKTVVRGGVGVFYFTYGAGGINQPGFSQTTTLVSTLDNFLTPAATLSNPFPTGILQPVGAAQGINTFLGQSVSYSAMQLDQPYSLRWTLGVQREIRPDLVLELGYIGSHAVHLTEDHDLNFVPSEYLSTSPVRDQANSDRLTAIVPNPFRNLLPGTNLNGSTTALENLLRAYSQFSGDGGVSLQSDNNGRSIFHMMQVRVEKRLSHGLQLLGNYQFSKQIETDRRLYKAAPDLEKRVADDDRPHRLVVSSSWDLPFQSKHRALGRMVNGWTLNGIYTFQPGAPLNFEGSNAIYYGGPLKFDPRAIDRAFDITRFELNSRNQLDRNVRTFSSRFNNLRADKVNNFDLSLIKSTRITERVSLQFRFETFNALNRASFIEPNLAPANASFGRISDQANLPRIVQMALRLKW